MADYVRFRYGSGHKISSKQGAIQPVIDHHTALSQLQIDHAGIVAMVTLLKCDDHSFQSRIAVGGGLVTE